MEIETPTDALIAVMEKADDLQTLLIIGMTKECKLLLCSSENNVVERLGLLEMAKFHIANAAIND